MLIRSVSVLSRVVFRRMLRTHVLSRFVGGQWVLSEFLEGQWLRTLILFSLICQIILVCLGDRRKYVPNGLIRPLTWLAYLMANSVASNALAMITNNAARIDNQYVPGYLIENITLTTFWAPFLLLHLGGPDRITAYSLEDNELWSRHCLTLFNQTAAIVAIFSFAWSQSRFYKLSILMMVPALIKYGERVWVLWAASSDHFKKFCPDLEPDHRSRILEEYKLKEIEGYKLISLTVNEVHEVMRTHVEADLIQLSDEQLYERCQFELLAARGLVDIFKRIFADLPLSFKEYDTSRSVLMGKNFLVVHRVIEIELGFLYDLLYTKALVIYGGFGPPLRFCSITVTFIVLILFTFTHKNKFLSSSSFDINVTYALLVVALLLEMYAVCELLSSDWTACRLINNKHFGFLKFINRFYPLHKRRRWSNSIGQYNLLSVSLEETQSSAWHRVLGYLRVDLMEAVQKYLYQSHEKVSDDLKGFIIKQLIADDRKRDAELPSPWTSRGSDALERNNQSVSLKWSIELEFAESIIVWHIATEICYHRGDPSSGDNSANSERDEETEARCKISEHLSRYMVYLVVMYPRMVPTETIRIRYQDTYAAALKFFEQETRERRRTLKMAEACKLLLDQMKTKDGLTVPNSRRSKSKFLLHNGCRLAEQLLLIADGKERWRVVSEVWMEMLAYAASECDAECHARQLRRGGELLTHVWFLMTHFGLTDYFTMKNAPAVVDMIVK
ncbi:uncharacterized protein LOC115744726 [Rhodamnia argentea]|uniref:Uncharacterized protein LOC115744726 n=1 Tax=Rhodamnia argentea TaxID=178133 RepID=A0A8B8PM80_9MYRT|nr:uncharacterized protein LOC115744726 [Rhodamnia argentea]